MRLKTLLSRSLLVAVGLLAGASSANAADTWDFTSDTWKSVTMPTSTTPSVSYNASGESATSGNVVTFYSTTGAITYNTSRVGIGFTATGSTSDNYVKVTVPAGYAASVSIYTSGNRTAVVNFGGTTTTYSNSSWATDTKNFDNTSGTTDVDLYIYCNQNAGGTTNPPAIKTITLTQAVPVVINYKDEEGNTIASPVTTLVETGLSFTPTYETTLYVSDTDPYVYTYKSGGDAVTINGSTSIDVIYSKSDRASHTVTITKSYGEKTSSEDVSVYDAANYTYYYPAFFLDGTTLYKYVPSTDASASTSYWTGTLSNVTADATVTLTYTALDGKCIYYQEGEDIEGASHYSNSTYTGRSSNGGIGVLTSKTITVLAPGSYTLTARVIGKADATNNRRKVDFYQTSTAGTSIVEVTSTTTGNEKTSEAFTLTANTPIVANGGYVTTSENGYGLDYVYIMQTSDDGGIATENLTINSSSSLASYSNDLAMTISDDEVVVYKASALADNTVTLTKVGTKVIPANTGVILYKNGGGEVTLTYGGTSTADFSGNLLTGTGSSTKTVTESESIYALVAGEQAIAKVNSDVVIPANKAYIETSAGAKLNIVFGDTVTGIDSVQTTNDTNDTNAIYNLAGQRVSKSYKGVVVKGGKKFLQR